MERTRLIAPIPGDELAELLQRLIYSFVPGFRIVPKTDDPGLIEYENSGVSIRRVRRENSSENSEEPWWPTSNWWECHVAGIPAIGVFNLYAGTSSPGAAEIYNFYEFTADEGVRERFEIEWRKVQLNRAIKGRKAVHSELMPKEWRDSFSKNRNLAVTGSFDWLGAYRLTQAEDRPLLVIEFDGKSWLATDDGELLKVCGTIPADRKTMKETRQRRSKGAEPYGLELALKLLPGERDWRELFHENSDTCFLDAAWGEKMVCRAWHNERWLMRQSVGGNKWGGLRSAYWLQPLALKDAARFSFLAMFEIYGGGATLSYDVQQYNTQYFYTVVGGINAEEKSAFLIHLDQIMKADGYEKESSI